MKRAKVWDVPTRLFHWSIVCLVVTSWLTADQGYMKAHFWSGIILFILLLFRIVWGFVGSTTARFGDFLRRPSEIVAYLKSLYGPEKLRHAGHNPAGGLMVITLLILLLLQVATGLYSNDGVGFYGPLAMQISSSSSDQLTQLHQWLFKATLFLVWMHLVAVFFYLCVRGDNLIEPMFSGYKSLKDMPPNNPVKLRSSALALAVLATVSCLVILFLQTVGA